MRRLARWEPSVQAPDTRGQSGETIMQETERTLMTHVQSVARNEEVLASVLVPRVTSSRDITVLETAMQGLALDDWHPVALELAATASSRHFLLRATSAMSQRHLADQVQARYPQAIIRPVGEPDDPLVLREGETARRPQRSSCARVQRHIFPCVPSANASCCKKERIPCSVSWACSTIYQLLCAW